MLALVDFLVVVAVDQVMVEVVVVLDQEVVETLLTLEHQVKMGKVVEEEHLIHHILPDLVVLVVTVL